MQLKWPDWKDPTDYPDPNTTEYVQWAWEFLRRNKGFQDDWETELLAYQSDGHDVREAILADPHFEIIPGVAEGSKGRRYFLQRYSLYTLPNPAQPRPAKLLFEPRYGEIRLAEGTGPLKVHLFAGQAIAVFDLSVPLRQQLAVVKNNLKDLQQRKALLKARKLRKKGAHAATYQRYLRVLDAKDADAKDKEIAAELHAHSPNDYEHDYLGTKKVRADLTAAERLLLEDYRFLAFGWITPDEK